MKFIISAVIAIVATVSKFCLIIFAGRVFVFLLLVIIIFCRVKTLCSAGHCVITTDLIARIQVQFGSEGYINPSGRCCVNKTGRPSLIATSITSSRTSGLTTIANTAATTISNSLFIEAHFFFAVFG